MNTERIILVNMTSLFQGGPKMVGLGLLDGISSPQCRHYHWILLLPSGVGFEERVRASSLQAENVEYAFVNYPTKRLRFVTKLFFDHLYVPYVCSRRKVDTLFMTANFASLFVLGRKQIVLQHNPHYLEDGPTERFEGASLRFLLERALFRATTLLRARYVVQLGCIKERLASRYPVVPENISIITMVPVRSEASAADVQQAREKVARELARSEPPSLNLFFPAKFHWNKNHQLLVPLAKALKDRGLSVRFFVTLEHDCDFLKQVEAAGLDTSICNLGYIDHRVIGSLYSMFDGLFFPTYSESFGFPYVEAINALVPIITTDFDFSREVCGDAALYFTQNDVVGAVHAIDRLGTPDVKQGLADNARNRRRMFSHDWHDVIDSIFLGSNDENSLQCTRIG
ncbi:glycosyltransferase [Paraburkholderia bryophila]|uniref:glycosyltransferase n=1 Tax=Burkholderiaceae TaxID=119060 RepID=UPI000551DA98|nr:MULTISPECIES: glycosyltransferase [Burkholderiaceae]